MRLVGFPHSDTAGSQDRGSFPAIIAAMRVLLRCLIPRHSLSALVKDFYDLHPNEIDKISSHGVNFSSSDVKEQKLW